jgi:hypothetical protein
VWECTEIWRMRWNGDRLWPSRVWPPLRRTRGIGHNLHICHGRCVSRGMHFLSEQQSPSAKKFSIRELRSRNDERHLLRHPRPLRCSSCPIWPHLPPSRWYSSVNRQSSSCVHSSFFSEGSNASLYRLEQASSVRPVMFSINNFCFHCLPVSITWYLTRNLSPLCVVYGVELE